MEMGSAQSQTSNETLSHGWALAEKSIEQPHVNCLFHQSPAKVGLRADSLIPRDFKVGLLIKPKERKLDPVHKKYLRLPKDYHRSGTWTVRIAMLTQKKRSKIRIRSIPLLDQPMSQNNLQAFEVSRTKVWWGVLENSKACTLYWPAWYHRWSFLWAKGQATRTAYFQLKL